MNIVNEIVNTTTNIEDHMLNLLQIENQQLKKKIQELNNQLKNNKYNYNREKSILKNNNKKLYNKLKDITDKLNNALNEIETNNQLNSAINALSDNQLDSAISVLSINILPTINEDSESSEYDESDENKVQIISKYDYNYMHNLITFLKKELIISNKRNAYFKKTLDKFNIKNNQTNSKLEICNKQLNDFKLKNDLLEEVSDQLSSIIKQLEAAENNCDYYLKENNELNKNITKIKMELLEKEIKICKICRMCMELLSQKT